MSSKKYGSNFLKGVRKYRVTPEDQSRAIERFLSTLDCPRALTVWLLFKNNEHDQLVALGFDPKHYLSKDDVFSAYQATKFLSKFKGLTFSHDLDRVAWKKFEEFELLCKQTNMRFGSLSTDSLYKGPVVWLHNAIIRKIDSLLGAFSVDEFLSSPDWGPGASTLIKRRDASSSEKFQNETGITRDLYALFPTSALKQVYPAWGHHLESKGSYPQFQVGNRVVTVPKDASTNRVIAIEPGLNLFFQKSLGDMIGKRLLRVGIDLHDQGKNQRKARKGSIDSSLATVDLSSASDSISYSIVEALLPPRWFNLLDIARSHYGSFNGQTVRWNKFSSMGNGFTFQLESLIFFAISFCCSDYVGADPYQVSVYGDDIVLPVSAKEIFSEMMNFYGFRINEKKSHFDSSFRESCGAHYFSGYDVKPLYLKEVLSSLQTVYRFANAIRRLASRQMNYLACDSRFRDCFDHLVSLVPKPLRLRIPETLGDGGFIGNFDECTPSRVRHGFEGYHVPHLTEFTLSKFDDRVGYYLASLWDISDRHQGFNPLLGNIDPSVLPTMSRLDWDYPPEKGYNSTPIHRTRSRITYSTVAQWSDLGPWL